MKNFCRVTVIAATMALIPHASLAAYETEACKEDVEKFCSDVEPGAGRIARCLGQHKDQLSETCKARGKELADKLQGFMQVCGADIDTHCAGVKPGEGRILKCLQEHKSDLSPDCSARLQPKRER